MAGEVSIQVADATRGIPATGMMVEIFTVLPERQRMVSAFLDGAGALKTDTTDFPRGIYELVLHVGTFYRSEGVELPDLPFLDQVPFRFGLGEANRPYNLSVSVTPWSFALFRR